MSVFTAAGSPIKALSYGLFGWEGSTLIVPSLFSIIKRIKASYYKKTQDAFETPNF